MLDRVEVIRGGGSALYGSSAIGGTVNIITKLPTKNSYDIGYTSQLINSKASDHNLVGNANLISKSKKIGATVFFNHRNRNWYDHNDDGFSELPKIENTSLGLNLFYKPTQNQKFEISLTNLNEYRYGGEMIDSEPHLALQSEERKHQVHRAPFKRDMRSGRRRVRLREVFARNVRACNRKACVQSRSRGARRAEHRNKA